MRRIISGLAKIRRTMGGDKEPFDLEDTKHKVEELWARTFVYSNKIIEKVQKLGFARLDEMKTPNIEEMLITLQIMSAVFEVLGAHADDVDETRMLLNARQQVLRMELLVSTWKAGDQDEFDKVVGELERQAQF